MKNDHLEDYLSSIDFSVVADSDVISNIYREIGNKGSALATNPRVSFKLEELIQISNADQLTSFLKTLDKKLVYKKLGSRIVECIYKKLFECMYYNNEYFSFKEVFEFIDVKMCFNSKDAVHVLRSVIILITGKKVDKFDVTKYKVVDSPEPQIKESSTTNISPNEQPSKEEKTNEIKRLKLKEEIVSNTDASKEIIQHLKETFKTLIPSIETEDSLITLVVFLQFTKSHSLIAELVASNCSVENIKNYSFCYEIIAMISNKENLNSIYDRIKRNIMELSLDRRSNYFIQRFISRFKYPLKIFKRIRLDQFESNSNVVLSLLEALQERKCHKEVEYLVKEYYNIKKDLFEEILLSGNEGINTKYVSCIVKFMNMSEKNNYGVNKSFINLFKKEWLRSKSGKTLFTGFLMGTCDTGIKTDFLNKNIDLFWKCSEWKDGKMIIKRIINYTTNHSKKKAYEIYSRFK